LNELLPNQVIKVTEKYKIITPALSSTLWNTLRPLIFDVLENFCESDPIT